MMGAAVPHAPGLAVVAAHYRIDLEPPLAPEQSRSFVEALVGTLADGAWREGASLIGHIKVIVDAGESGFLYASSTGDGTPPHARGEMTREFTAGTLTVNMLVYGADRARLEAVLAASVVEMADRYSFRHAAACEGSS